MLKHRTAKISITTDFCGSVVVHWSLTQISVSFLVPVPSHTNFCASSFSNWCHIGFLFKIFFDTRIAAELTKEVTDKELLNALGIHRVPYVKSFENIMANDGHHERWKWKRLGRGPNKWSLTSGLCQFLFQLVPHWSLSCCKPTLA